MLTALSHPAVPVLFIRALIVALVLAAIAYVALVSATVAYVTHGNQYSTELRNATSAIASLQTSYSAAEAGLTLNYALSLGLALPSHTLFVDGSNAEVSLAADRFLK